MAQYEKDLEDSNDPDLQRKFRDLKQMNEDISTQLAQKNYSMIEKAKDASLVMEQYENMKKS